MNKDQQIHIRLSKEEKEVVQAKAKGLGFKQISEYMRVIALNEVGKTYIPPIFKNIELSRPFLFLIKTNDEKLDTSLTVLIREVSIEEDKIKIIFLLDDNNTWYDFLKSSKDFKICWLNRIGDIVNSFTIRNINKKVFPLKFSHENIGLANAMAIFTYKFDEMR
jgi:hypothetical protein